jgi:hypothetical protein
MTTVAILMRFNLTEKTFSENLIWLKTILY